ncbi:MAG: hypothetical protein JWN11_1687 [Hyphomicrobiales bacterium]|nr:hypothetical protein [Hyphomicrobiales bacterium]
MTKDEVKQLDDKGIAAWDQHDSDAFLSLLADDFVWYDWTVEQPMRDKGAARDFFNSWITAFPDLHFRRSSQIVGDDAVAGELDLEGTNNGPLTVGSQTMPPTQKKISTHAAYSAQIRYGKIVEFHTHADTVGMLMQLGMMPTAH